MSLPASFTTQSLGELTRQDDQISYRPVNQNKHHFLFQPDDDSDPAAWIALIDHRAPLLNSRWPAILASAPEGLKSALADIGQNGLPESAGLRHITLISSGEAVLLVGLSASEESHSLEVTLNHDGHVKTVAATR